MEIVYIVITVIEVILTSVIVFHFIRLKMLVDDKRIELIRNFELIFNEFQKKKKTVSVIAKVMRFYKKYNKKIEDINKFIDSIKKLDKAIKILNNIDFKNLRLKQKAKMKIFPLIRKILFLV